MTRDPRTERLLQQELDGANTPEESAELERSLSTDPALRADYERLRALVGELDAEEPAGPSSPLWPEVEAALAADADRRPTRVSAPARRWWRPRLALAFAAGLAVGLIALLVVVGVDPGGDGQRPYASLGALPPSARPLAGSPWTMDEAGRELSVVAAASDGAITVVAALDAGEELRVDLLVLDGQTFLGWRSERGRVRATTGARGGEFRWSGPDRVTVWFSSAADGAGRVSLETEIGGRRHATVLGTPPGER